MCIELITDGKPSPFWSKVKEYSAVTDPGPADIVHQIIYVDRLPTSCLLLDQAEVQLSFGKRGAWWCGQEHPTHELAHPLTLVHGQEQHPSRWNKLGPICKSCIANPTFTVSCKLLSAKDPQGLEMSLHWMLFHLAPSLSGRAPKWPGWIVMHFLDSARNPNSITKINIGKWRWLTTSSNEQASSIWTSPHHAVADCYEAGQHIQGEPQVSQTKHHQVPPGPLLPRGASFLPTCGQSIVAGYLFMYAEMWFSYQCECVCNIKKF